MNNFGGNKRDGVHIKFFSELGSCGFMFFGYSQVITWLSLSESLFLRRPLLLHGVMLALDTLAINTPHLDTLALLVTDESVKRAPSMCPLLNSMSPIMLATAQLYIKYCNLLGIAIFDVQLCYCSAYSTFILALTDRM